MAEHIELYDLKNKADANFFIDLAETCTKRSEWTLSSGKPSNEFINIDEYMYNPQKSSELAKRISIKLKEILAYGDEFDKLAFIEKPDGTVGLITLLGSISIDIDMPCIIIRPKKRLQMDTIKGKVSFGERILIISDIATSGSTIFSAAEILRSRGGKTPYALVVLDRLQGATENLVRKGIKLFSLSSINSINKTRRMKIPYKITPPVLKDFGGKSMTTSR
jgi:orotate phosphoribosyltransferase